MLENISITILSIFILFVIKVILYKILRESPSVVAMTPLIQVILDLVGNRAYLVPLCKYLL